MKAYTGVQKQVLRLYRGVLRALQSKPQDVQAEVQAFTRQELDRNKGVASVQLKEHLIRQGYKKLEILRSPEFKGFRLLQQQRDKPQAS